MPPYWAVIRCVPNHDRLAAECVAQAGFEIFTPKIRTRLDSRWRTVPLFAGYLFVRIVDRWRILERTLGVLNVVKVGTTPSRCPDAAITELLDRADPDGVVRLARAGASVGRPSFAAGTKVMVTGGAFRGFSGLHSGQTAREREIILLEQLGGPRPVEVPACPVAARG
jgi:transcription antitermination factor NusG